MWVLSVVSGEWVAGAVRVDGWECPSCVWWRRGDHLSHESGCDGGVEFGGGGVEIGALDEACGCG